MTNVLCMAAIEPPVTGEPEDVSTAVPPVVTRTVPRTGFAPAARALIQPVMVSATTVATPVTGIRKVGGGTSIATSGSSAPSVNETADEMAACLGLISSWGSRPSSSSTWAMKGAN